MPLLHPPHPPLLDLLLVTAKSHILKLKITARGDLSYSSSLCLKVFINHRCPLVFTACDVMNARLPPCIPGWIAPLGWQPEWGSVLITGHMHSSTIHRRHYSGTNQGQEKDNVSWKTTSALITDTLSHAYWLSPRGIRKISWMCRQRAGRCCERCGSTE